MPFPKTTASPKFLLFHIVLCLLSTVVCCYLLREILPFPEIQITRAKYEHFVEHANEYTVVFLGSSRLFRGVSPAVFDQTLKRRGIKTRSFNFAAPGMRLFERIHLLNRLLDLEKAQLEWVFLEFDTSYMVEEENRTSNRVIYWHDLPTTRLALRMTRHYTQISGKPLNERLEKQFDHLLPFLHRTFNLGRLQETVVKGWAEFSHEEPLVRELGPADDGYVSREVAGTGRGERKEFLRQLDSYQRWVELFSIPNRNERPDPYVVELARSLQQRVEKAGAGLVFLLPPGIKRHRRIECSFEGLDDLILFSFQDPSEYPEIYSINRRYDEGHLNEVGAAFFSRLLAERFANEALEVGSTK